MKHKINLSPQKRTKELTLSVKLMLLWLFESSVFSVIFLDSPCSEKRYLPVDINKFVSPLKSERKSV